MRQQRRQSQSQQQTTTTTPPAAAPAVAGSSPPSAAEHGTLSIHPPGPLDLERPRGFARGEFARVRQWAPMMALKAGWPFSFLYTLGDPKLASDRNESCVAFRGCTPAL